MNWDALKAPFPAEDIEWRIQSSGEKNGQIWARCLAYVTNRAIMHRLDEVVGPQNWRNEYLPAPCGGVMCGLSVRIDGEWVTKWDGAENTDIEGVKGGLSGAMKRAAVQWGIGRYLYDLEEGFAEIAASGKHSAKTKDGKWFKWNPPALPSWALPAGAAQTPKQNGNGRQQAPRASNGKPATQKQIELVDKLSASHVFSDEDRKSIAEKLNSATVEEAAKLIDRMQKTIDKRKAAEKENA